MSVTQPSTFDTMAAKAAPWWIALGVTGVAVAVVAGTAPLLASLTLIGIGSDADLGRRLREALAAEGEPVAGSSHTALVAGFIRRVHAGMYALLVVFAWASLLHLAAGSINGSSARWWLAADVAGSAVIALGYARLARRHG